MCALVLIAASWSTGQPSSACCPPSCCPTTYTHPTTSPHHPTPLPGDWAELELDTRADGKGIRTDKDGKRLKANIWLSYLRSYQVRWRNMGRLQVATCVWGLLEKRWGRPGWRACCSIACMAVLQSCSQQQRFATHLPPPPPHCTAPPPHTPSMQHMGVARVECRSGCRCEPTTIDSTWHKQVSLQQIHMFRVSQHEACVMRVTVVEERGEAKSDGHKVRRGGGGGGWGGLGGWGDCVDV